MPIDSSIALSGVNVGDVIDRAQNQYTQQQAAQQQAQLQKYSVAEAKQQFEDQQNWKAAYSQANGDWGKAISIAAKLGVSPKAIQAIQTGYIQQQQAQSTLDESKLKVETGRREQMYSELQDLHDIKDPGQFTTALDQKIKNLKTYGILKPEDMSVLGTLNPGNFDQAVNTFLSPDSQAKIRTANAKQDTANVTRAKLPGEIQNQSDAHAAAITKQNQAALQDADRTLTAALTSGGPLAYRKALEGMQGPAGDYVRGQMPAADAIAGTKSPQEAIGLIHRGAMTAAEQSTADQQASNAARETAALAEKTRHDQMTERLASATNAREAQKFSMEFGGDAVKGWTEQLKQNPSAIEDMPANLRTAVSQEFAKQTGAPLPTKLTGADKTTFNNAGFARGVVSDLRNMAQTPEVQAILGPVSGRIAKGQSTAGMGLTSAQQEFVTKLEYLFAGEGKTIFGGRAPEKLMEGLKAVSASPSKGLPQLLGSLDATDQVAQQRQQAIVAGQFGGKLPSFYGKAAQGQSASPAAPKVASVQDIAAYAKANKMSIDAARAAAIKEGYTVK